MKLHYFFLLLIFLTGFASAQEFYASLEFSPDGRYLAAGRSDGTLRVFDVQTRKPVKEAVQMGSHNPLYELTWRGNQHVLSRGLEEAGVYSVVTGKKELFRYESGMEGVYGAFSADGELLLTDSQNGISIREMKSGKKLCTIDFPTTRGSSYAFSPDKKRVAVNRDHAVVVYDTSTGKRVSKLQKDAVFTVSDLRFTSEGTLLTNDPHAVREWNVETGKEVRDLGRGYHFTTSEFMLLTPGESGVVSSGNSNGGWQAQFWSDRKDKTTRTELKGRLLSTLPGNGVLLESWSDDQDSHLIVYRPGAEPVQLGLAGVNGPLNDSATSPDGKLLAYPVVTSDEIRWVELP